MTPTISAQSALGVFAFSLVVLAPNLPAPAQKKVDGPTSTEVRLSEHTSTISVRPPLQAVQQWRSPFSAASTLFSPPVLYPSGATDSDSIAIGDLNQDGKPDLVIGSRCSSSYSSCDNASGHGVVTVLLGNGDGTFQTALPYDDGAGAVTGIVLADVNGDGKLDVIVAASCSSGFFCENTVAVFLGNGDGTLQPPVNYDAGGAQESMQDITTSSVAVGDFNGDGKPDIVVSNQCASPSVCDDGALGVLLNNGDGTFQPVISYDPSGTWTSGVAVADVNGDGKLDVVVSNCGPRGGTGCSEGDVGVLIGKGDGTFEPVVLYDAAGLGSVSVSIADLNHDGRPDILVGNFGITKGTVSVLLNAGNGTFQSAISYPSAGTWAGAVSSADINSDGNIDVLLANLGSADISLYLGNGDGTLRAARSYDVGVTAPASLAVADLDGNKSPDLAVANQCNLTDCSSSTVSVFLNDVRYRSPSSTTLASSLNPSIYGQTVTFTATVSNDGGPNPTGKVWFTWGIEWIATATLNASGVAIWATSGLNADNYPMTAVYKGDSNNLSSTSQIVDQVVSQATSSATLTSSPNPSTLGQAVTFTAKITSSTARPSGPVTFTAGKIVLGNVELSNGKATLTTTSLDTGSTTITATFAGDSDIQCSSAAVTQVVR